MISTRCFALIALLLASSLAAAADKPNVVIFYADDMGYGDLSSYGNARVPTPHIDAIGKAGVRFTHGYVAACVCSPSRVGLMTGRHQARTGHDANTTGRAGSGLDRGEITFAQRMKSLGYATGLVGKWHLGDQDGFLPPQRGFDEFIGTRSNLGERESQFMKQTESIAAPPGAPITSPFWAAQARGFIERHAEKPFFLYVAFNAVHAPHVANESYLKRFSGMPKPQQNFTAMIAELDDAVGAIMGRLRELKLEDNTLVFFISDNGGAGQADNGGLSGGKWSLLEGGIRVPFLMQWKSRVPGGQVLAEPVVQLDVLPTAIAAAGASVSPDWKLDGVNLLPLLTGETPSLQRAALFWRFGVQFGIRQGDFKLIKPSVNSAPKLFNVVTDPGEQNDVAAQQPERVKAMLALWEKWNAGNIPPRWEDRRWNGLEEKAALKAGKKTKKKKKASD